MIRKNLIPLFPLKFLVLRETSTIGTLRPCVAAFFFATHSDTEMRRALFLVQLSTETALFFVHIRIILYFCSHKVSTFFRLRHLSDSGSGEAPPRGCLLPKAKARRFEHSGQKHCKSDTTNHDWNIRSDGIRTRLRVRVRGLVQSYPKIMRKLHKYSKNILRFLHILNKNILRFLQKGVFLQLEPTNILRI